MKKISKILCPVGLWDELTEGIFECAAEIACKFNAEILLLYVSPMFPEYAGVGDSIIEGNLTVSAAVEKEAQARMKQMEAKDIFKDLKVSSYVLSGEPVDEIILFAQAKGADIIIMGTHGRRGMDRFFFGSVAEKIVRTSPVPVLTIRPKE